MHGLGGPNRNTLKPRRFVGIFWQTFYNRSNESNAGKASRAVHYAGKLLKSRALEFDFVKFYPQRQPRGSEADLPAPRLSRLLHP